MFCPKHAIFEDVSAITRVVVRSFAVVFLVVLVGCASRPDEAPEIRTLTPQEAVDPVFGPVKSGDITALAEDNKQTVLALSAGGADGAFGAGVLAGWTASGERPNFDVVTGVSTGALLAVLAFLGPEYDDLTRELYTTQTNETIFKNRGLQGILGDSLYDNAPFRAQIERYITPALLQKVAAEHRKGRRLYVATTNLDAGELVIWNMGEIALGGRADPLLHFQKVLRASASVPGFFQPVYIKPKRGVQLRQAHVDGGVKEPVLYADFMAATTQDTKHLYMVINGTTRRFNASTPVKANLASISQKTITELLRELQRETIYRHYTTARETGVDFFITSIPDSIPIAEESLDFDPKRMRLLYQAGFNSGSKGLDAWAKEPPTSRSTQQQASVED